jgi:hypothetical protein
VRALIMDAARMVGSTHGANVQVAQAHQRLEASPRKRRRRSLLGEAAGVLNVTVDATGERLASLLPLRGFERTSAWPDRQTDGRVRGRSPMKDDALAYGSLCMRSVGNGYPAGHQSVRSLVAVCLSVGNGYDSLVASPFVHSSLSIATPFPWKVWLPIAGMRIPFVDVKQGPNFLF